MWKEYLSFSKSERITFLTLTIIIILLLILSRGINAIKIMDSPNLAEEAMIMEYYNSLNDSIDSLKNRRATGTWQPSCKAKSSSIHSNFDASITSKSSKSRSKSKNRDMMQIEINSADTAIFALLPGVGPTISSRIVKYRSSLKGFYEKEQLLEVFGVDSLLFDKISPYLVVDSISIEKLNFNQISIARMKNHPYLDFYQAKEVYEYRLKFGNFKSIKDVLLLSSFENINRGRIEHYFCVN